MELVNRLCYILATALCCLPVREHYGIEYIQDTVSGSDISGLLVIYGRTMTINRPSFG